MINNITPNEKSAKKSTIDHYEDFQMLMAENGLPCHEPIKSDGQIHRYSADGLTVLLHVWHSNILSASFDLPFPLHKREQ